MKVGKQSGLQPYSTVAAASGWVEAKAACDADTHGPSAAPAGPLASPLRPPRVPGEGARVACIKSFRDLRLTAGARVEVGTLRQDFPGITEGPRLAADARAIGGGAQWRPRALWEEGKK